jgi:uncharacterized alkaline shock family protein YloU
MDGHASISNEIIARYAADAAREVEGVRRLVEGPLPRRRGVRVSEADGRLEVELHLCVAWGASIPQLGRDVQDRVRDYLVRKADLEPAAVNVVVAEIGEA